MSQKHRAKSSGFSKQQQHYTTATDNQLQPNEGQYGRSQPPYTSGSYHQYPAKSGQSYAGAAQVPKIDIGEVTETIERLQRTIAEKDKEIQDLKTSKMSNAMNEKMSRDESNLENINLRNRPLKLVESFTYLCSDQWMAAKDDIVKKAVQGRFDEQRQCELLNEIIMRSYACMKTEHERQREMLKNVLDDPFSFSKEGQSPTDTGNATGIVHTDTKHKSQQEISLTPELDVAVSSYLKLHSDDLNFDVFPQEILRDIGQTIRTDELQSIVESRPLHKYCEEVCKLSWNMIIQLPPMVFDFPGIRQSFDSKTQELSMDSKDPAGPGAKVAYYLHPAIKHGGNLLQKGRVCVLLYHS